MHIEKIHYELNANLGDGASETITLVAVPGEDEGIGECVELLRELATKAKLPNKWEIYEEIKTKVDALKTLENRIENRTKSWEELAHFLRTQGINPDIPNAPLKLLPQRVDGEIVEVKDDF